MLTQKRLNSQKVLFFQQQKINDFNFPLITSKALYLKSFTSLQGSE